MKTQFATWKKSQIFWWMNWNLINVCAVLNIKITRLVDWLGIVKTCTSTNSVTNNLNETKPQCHSIKRNPPFPIEQSFHVTWLGKRPKFRFLRLSCFSWKRILFTSRVQWSSLLKNSIKVHNTGDNYIKQVLANVPGRKVMHHRFNAGNWQTDVNLGTP